MPSLLHRVVALYARRFLRNGDIGDPEQVRRDFPGQRKAARFPKDWSRDDALPFPVWTHGTGAPLLYLHGGSYTADAAPQHFALCARLAEATGRRIVLPQYPLAPEHTWVSSHGELTELAQRLASEGDLVLAGDSAGGGYALSIAQAVRDAGGPQPSRLVLIAPWVDLTGTAHGIEAAAARDPWLRLDWLHLYAGWWAGSEDARTRWEVSPGLGSLAGLPPTLVLQGTRDLLHPENLALRERARDAEWDLTLIERDGLIHVYPLLPIPEAKEALREMVAFLS